MFPMFQVANVRKIKISKPLFGLLLATFLLVALLVVSTVRNISREQKILESFLLDEGLTLIRSFEAGARTTMMHEMMSVTPPVVTLVRETAKVKRIAFISITTDDGVVVASAGAHNVATDLALTAKVLAGSGPVTALLNIEGKEPIFEIVTRFQTLPGASPSMMREHWQDRDPLMTKLEKGEAVIHIGLRTGEFIAAQKQDVKHTMFMGGILFLLSSGVFYFLFLYQGMRVTQTTLANMRLYTRNIIESMPDGLVTLDSQGRMAACNPRAFEFMGLVVDEQKGHKPGELFPGWPVGSLADHGRISSFSYTFSHSDGSEVPVEIGQSPLLDEEGRAIGAVLLLRDLREIREMEEQLARSQRLASLGRMAAGIAHEIRNPLGTLRGFAQYFGSKAEDDASREYSNLMVGEVDRLNTIISTLLQFSRPRDPEFEMVELGPLFEKVDKLLEFDFSENDMTLVHRNSCGGVLDVDVDLLLQVLLNLLKNAINASKAGDKVILSCEMDKENVYITVTDVGVGMTGEQREQMFDPFFTTRKSGTGLGLAICHQIVEQHQGFIEVMSQPAKGTCVTLVLPKLKNKV